MNNTFIKDIKSTYLNGCHIYDINTLSPGEYTLVVVPAGSGGPPCVATDLRFGAPKLFYDKMTQDIDI